MIWWLLIQAFSTVVQTLSYFVPDGWTVDTLPYGVDEFLTAAVGPLYAIMDWFPPAVTLFHIALLTIPVMLFMMGMKVFMGHRSPIK